MMRHKTGGGVISLGRSDGFRASPDTRAAANLGKGGVFFDREA